MEYKYVDARSEGGETLNMHPNNPKELGGDRLKPFVVVTADWFRGVISLFARLKLLTSGAYVCKGKVIPHTNDVCLLIREGMIDNDLEDWDDLMEPLLLSKEQEVK